jgi:signal transduction histidine kinase
MTSSVALAAWLRDHAPEILEQGRIALESSPAAMALPHDELAPLLDALVAALERNDTAAFDRLFATWMKRQADVALEYRLPLLPVITSLETALWDILPQQMKPIEALAGLRMLDPLFSLAVLRLSELQTLSAQAKLTEELDATKRHLERLDKTKSDFISIAAHELKTPLTLIEGYASMMALESEAAGDTRSQMLLTGIRNGAKRLGEIVQDMIDVSLIDTAVLTLRYQPVRFRRLVEMLTIEWQSNYEERHVELSIGEFEDGGEITYADPERLYQVFNNILGNSLKYTPDGGRVVITSRTLPGQDPQGRAGFVEIMVADNGIGIAADDQERIFQKFERVGSVALHSSGKTKFKGGGPGLGLAIARGVVDAHGGSLWVESPGHDEVHCPGSTFHVLLPLYYEPPEDKSSRLLGIGGGNPQKR